MTTGTFFTDRNHIPDGIGFAHFDATHLIFLCGIIVGIVCISALYRRAGEKMRGRLRVAVAGIVLALEITKQMLCAFLGVYDWNILPLHLCGITIIVIAIHTARPTAFTGEFLYSLSVPGAVMALLFPDWTMYPPANFFCLQSFIIHMFEIAYPVMLLCAGELRPNARRLWMPLVFMLAITPPIFLLNRALGTNFFFLSEPAPGSPLSMLESLLGSPGYIFGTIGILAAVWLLLYAPLYIARRLRKKVVK
ncbi:MAG: TIGR02206 family membrane protein [Clostridiales Family XIII bacterium]|nr:TIGR02206 family membrane protein [Clostridiales Family XIII bacterium]